MKVDTTRRSAVLAEVLEVYRRLTGPGNEPIDEITETTAVGIAPAAACYAMPPWARSTGADEKPLLWLWPAPTWGAGDRDQELSLAAAFGVAAAVDYARRGEQPRPTLSVVREDGSTSRRRRPEPDVPGWVVGLVEQRRAQLVDLDGGDPARSLRPRADERMALAAACYLLPSELRAQGRSAVPLMWAMPDHLWIDYPDRLDELIEGVALLLATIELTDVTRSYRSRPAPLTVIDGEGNGA